MKYNDLYELLKILIDIADEIAIKYKQLKTMEISCLNNETIFQNTLKELKNLKEKEDNIYKNIILSKEEITKLQYILAYNYNFDIDKTIEEVLHLNENKFFGYQRVFFKLESIIQNDVKFSYEKNINMNSLLSRSSTINQIKLNLLYRKTLRDNYYCVVMTFINSYIENNEEYKEAFIHLKYVLPFLYPELENINLDEDIYLYHTLVADFNKIPESVRLIIENQIIFEKFASENDRLLAVKNIDENKQRFNIKLSEILMRSSIIFFGEDIIDYRKKQFEEYIKNNYLKYIQNDKMISIILKIYNSSKKDKAHFKTLSLKPN